MEEPSSEDSLEDIRGEEDEGPPSAFADCEADYQKAATDDEDSFLDLYCEEEKDPGSTTCADCEADYHETGTDGKAVCRHVKTTQYKISHELISQPVETPVGEMKNHIVINCREEETLQETTDTNDSTEISDHGQQNLEEEGKTQKTNLETLLEDLGLEKYHKEKLTLSKILGIDETTITDDLGNCKSNIPLNFLKKLVMVNVTARNVKGVSCDLNDASSESNCDDPSESTESDFEDLFESSNKAETFNPLDIITALFLCSDGFVHQELALKMSMCQFSVPLLLPNCDTQQCTLMLWAMRDIVKKYRPSHLTESKGFIEERIVLSELPMISFVRLGECSLSKSEILNKLLSNSEQYHERFVHHNMECGDIQRRISNGLTEMTWYLPCGNKNMDIFSEPVAIANLRGDIASFETQFSFLCQTSAAVFVFFDQLDSECKLLMNKNQKAQIFLVGNQQSKNLTPDGLKKILATLGLTKNNIIIKTNKTNDADFVKSLKKVVSSVLVNPQSKMSVEQMADVAHELGISVDEDSPECQDGKKNADFSIKRKSVSFTRSNMEGTDIFGKGRISSPKSWF